MENRTNTTRKLNIETLAKREVFAANVFASMAMPIEKLDTPILVGRFQSISNLATEHFTGEMSSDTGDRVKQRINKHNSKINRDSGVPTESLKTLNSVKPIHAEKEAEDNHDSEKVREKKRRLIIEYVRQELGLSESNAKKVKQRSDLRSKFRRVHTTEREEIEYDASSYALGVDPAEAKKAGLKTTEDLWKTEGTLQEVGSPKTTGDIITESNSMGGGKQNSKKLVDQQVKNAIGQGSNRGSVDDAIGAAMRAQYGMSSTSDSSNKTNSEDTSTTETSGAGQGETGNPSNSFSSGENTDGETTSSDDLRANSGSATTTSEEENATGNRTVTITDKTTYSDGTVHVKWTGTDSKGNTVEGETEYFRQDDGTWNMQVSWEENDGYHFYEKDNSDAPPTAEEGDTTSLIDGDPADSQEAHFGVDNEDGSGGSGDDGSEDESSEDDSSEDDSSEDDSSEDDSSEDNSNSGSDEDQNNNGGDETPNPQDEEIGEGRFLYGEGTIEGGRERNRKKKEIHSNLNGYGTSGPNPIAEENDSDGPVYSTGNHDDGNNHVKEKKESTGRTQDILVKAGGGAADPRAYSSAANVDTIMSWLGR